MNARIQTLQNNRKTFYIYPVTSASCTYMSDNVSVEDKINTLSTSVNNTYTKAQTDQKIAEKIAEVIADAPASFDTLKEISDWISGHENSAAAMNSAIQTNASNISTLQTEKVDKEVGKGLSTNDYTTEEKNKLAGLSITASADGSSLSEIRFGIDSEGNYGYYKAGADSVTPFKTGDGSDNGVTKLYFNTPYRFISESNSNSTVLVHTFSPAFMEKVEKIRIYGVITSDTEYLNNDLMMYLIIGYADSTGSRNSHNYPIYYKEHDNDKYIIDTTIELNDLLQYGGAWYDFDYGSGLFLYVKPNASVRFESNYYNNYPGYFPSVGFNADYYTICVNFKSQDTSSSEIPVNPGNPQDYNVYIETDNEESETLQIEEVNS